jgi:hypothetical protein
MTDHVGDVIGGAGAPYSATGAPGSSTSPDDDVDGAGAGFGVAVGFAAVAHGRGAVIASRYIGAASRRRRQNERDDVSPEGVRDLLGNDRRIDERYASAGEASRGPPRRWR